MPALSDLIKIPSTKKALQMSSKGRALWLVWDGKLPEMVPTILEEYGGTCVTSADNQALWFFFTNDVLLALGRLKVWGTFNRTSLFVEIFDAYFNLTVDRDTFVLFDPLFTKQNISPEPGLQIWAHPSVIEAANIVPGLSFASSKPLAGMPPVGFALLNADSSLPYKSTQGWYAVLRPLGKPLDKGFEQGWKYMHSLFSRMLLNLQLKYSLESNVFIIRIASLRDLRAYVQQLLELFNDVQPRGSQYWPCLSVIADHTDYMHSAGLLDRVGLHWDDVMPDTLYVTYRNAFLLGKSFKRNDLEYSANATTVSSWVTLSLGSTPPISVENMPILIAGQLIKGSEEKPCFYCGAKNHSPLECPARSKPMQSQNLWKALACTDMATANESFRQIESTLEEKGIAGYRQFEDINTQPGLFMQSILEINLASQARVIFTLWEANEDFMPKGMRMKEEVSFERAKILPKKKKRPRRASSQDKSPAWDLLVRFLKSTSHEIFPLDKDIAEALRQNPRDVYLHSLSGFYAMERGRYEQAMESWRMAERISGGGLLQAWHGYLQGRLHEIQGEYTEAGMKYREVSKENPNWLDAKYRYLVCCIKRGFVDLSKKDIREMLDTNPYVFNRFLIDPELYRGYLSLVDVLYPLWAKILPRYALEKENGERIGQKLGEWFDKDEQATKPFFEEWQRIKNISEKHNFVAYFGVTKAYAELDHAMQIYIDKCVAAMREEFGKSLIALEAVRDEASWFPFPKALIEFNRLFRSSISILNWFFSSNLFEAQAFRQSKEELINLNDFIKQLEKRLTVLRIVRDATLCALILGRSFFWMFLVGAVLSIAVVMGLLFFGDVAGLSGLQEIIRKDHWDIQGMLLLIVSLLSFGIATLRVTLTFEKRRDKLLEEAKQQRKSAKERYKEARGVDEALET